MGADKTRKIDWQSGRWVKDASLAVTHEIVIAGDWAPIRAFDEIIASRPEAIYGDLLPELRQSDLRIVNLECCLTDQETPICKSGSVFKGRPEHVAGLTSVPFHCATLANNHVFDYGPAAFRQTEQLLSAGGIRGVGAGSSVEEAARPQYFDLAGSRIAVISFSEGEDMTAAGGGPGVLGWEIDRVAASVREARQNADFVIAIGHAGLEYIAFPPPYVVKTFQSIAEAGADLVVGHHPHVPQGVQIHGDVPIAYSLGNFAFYQPTDLKYRKVGYLLKAQLAGGKLAGIRLVPYRIGETGLSLLRGEALSWFWEELRKVSEPLDTPAGVVASWQGFLNYYNVDGFIGELTLLMGKLKEDPLKGAAMMRNRLTTMQHWEHWVATMTAIVEETIGEAPDWACELTRTWLTTRL